MSNNENVTIPRWVLDAYQQMMVIVADFQNAIYVWENGIGSDLGDWYLKYTRGFEGVDSDPLENILSSMKTFDKLLIWVFDEGPVSLDMLKQISEKLGYERVAGGWFKGDSMLIKTFAKEEGESIGLSKWGIRRLHSFNLVDRQGVKLTEMGRRILERVRGD